MEIERKINKNKTIHNTRSLPIDMIKNANSVFKVLI